MKKRIAIIAPTGMLGSMLYKCMKDEYSLVLIYKDKNKLKQLERTYGSFNSHKLIQFDIVDLSKDFLTGFHSFADSRAALLKKQIGRVDRIINCAGIIKPYALINPQLTYFVNSAFPHILSGLYGDKLIHITTDCVYDGIKGAPYGEDAIHTPNDLYGLSKSLGEPSSKSLVLRTSIVGPELSGKVSLLEWFLKQKDEVTGYSNHYWNGLTTKEFAKICHKIISGVNRFPQSGLFHVYGADVSKYEMLVSFKKKYMRDIEITKSKAEKKIDRRLTSKYKFINKLAIPSFEQMIQEL